MKLNEMDLWDLHDDPTQVDGHEYRHMHSPKAAYNAIKLHKHTIRWKNVKGFTGNKKNKLTALELKQAISAVAKGTDYAIKYTREVLGNKRFPQFEKVLIKNKNMRNIFRYLETINSPFPEAEKLIAKNSHDSMLYANRFLKGRFKLGEPAIFTKGHHAGYAIAMQYITGALQGERHAGAEKIFAKEAIPALRYAQVIMGGRFPAGEQAIYSDKATRLDYRRFLKSRGIKFSKSDIKSD